MGWRDPINRMKWGFIPVRRVVDEDVLEKIIAHQEHVKHADEGTKDADAGTIDTVDEKAEIANLQIARLATDDTDETKTYEYRDEKGRKWWKFFDEYEYRVQKTTANKRKWYKWFHDDDTPAERRLLTKIDVLLTFYLCMAYLVKYLDQTNINLAYIGGLKEGIGMKGNDLVQTQAMWTVGAIVFQIPFIYIILAYPLLYILPGLDIGWSIITILQLKVTNVGQLKALRFLIGAFEVPFYVGFHTLFSAWLKQSTGEGARRAGFYYTGQYLGLLTSGLISGLIMRHLDGKNGYAGWQWIFIVDGIALMFVGILGFYMIPGTPTDCYSAFLTDDDIRVARKRMVDDGKDARPQKEMWKIYIQKETWIRMATLWEIYVMILYNSFLWCNNNGTLGAYALWLKSLTNDDGSPRYSPGTLQDMTALTPALGLLYLLLTCSFADLLSLRWGAICFSQVFNIIGNTILAVWAVPESAKWFAWALQYFGWAMSPVAYQWQGDILRTDTVQKTINLVVMNMFGQTASAWTLVLVWKTEEAPRFLKGYTFTACCAFAIILWTFVVLYLYKKNERKHARENGIILYNSDDPDSIPEEAK